MRTNTRNITRSVRRAAAGSVLGLAFVAGVLAGPAEARPVFRDQSHMQSQCEGAGGTWTRTYDGDGRLTGYRCVFRNGDQLWCGKDWTNPDNCVYLDKAHLLTGWSQPTATPVSATHR